MRKFWKRRNSNSNKPSSNNGYLDDDYNTPKRNTYTVESFKSKPFWFSEDKTEHEIWWKKSGGACCFNHMIGLPWKDNPENVSPIFDYEIKLQKQLEQYKLVWIKKARGLGITEFMLRYMIWKYYFSNEYRHSNFIIVAGTRQDVANTHIKRIKRMVYPFEPHVIDEKETVASVNGYRIEAIENVTYLQFKDKGRKFVGRTHILVNPSYYIVVQCPNPKDLQSKFVEGIEYVPFGGQNDYFAKDWKVVDIVDVKTSTLVSNYLYSECVSELTSGVSLQVLPVMHRHPFGERDDFYFILQGHVISNNDMQICSVGNKNIALYKLGDFYTTGEWNA